MIEVLQFIFSGFWTWLDCCILIACFRPMNVSIKRKSKNAEASK